MMAIAMSLPTRKKNFEFSLSFEWNGDKWNVIVCRIVSHLLTSLLTHHLCPANSFYVLRLWEIRISFQRSEIFRTQTGRRTVTRLMETWHVYAGQHRLPHPGLYFSFAIHLQNKKPFCAIWNQSHSGNTLECQCGIEKQSPRRISAKHWQKTVNRQREHIHADYTYRNE